MCEQVKENRCCPGKGNIQQATPVSRWKKGQPTRFAKGFIARKDRRFILGYRQGCDSDLDCGFDSGRHGLP